MGAHGSFLAALRPSCFDTAAAQLVRTIPPRALLSAAVKLRPAISLSALLLVSFVAPESAKAAPSEEVIPIKTGFVEVRGGVRVAPQGGFEKSQASQGFALKSKLVTPVVFVPLGYRIDRNWAALVEFGYGNGQYDRTETTKNETSTLRSTTISIAIAGQWTPDLGWDRLEPFLGVGGGYYLTSLKSTDGAITAAMSEANTTGFFVSAGLRWAPTTSLGVVLENRYALAVAGVGTLGAVNVGGYAGSLGLYYVWK